MHTEDILKQNHIIAVVGISNSPDRPSYGVAQYLQEHGYRVIPVNPGYEEVLGEKCYPNLTSIPHHVDIVDIFRRPEDVVPIVEQAIKIGAKVIWMQEGIENEEAALKTINAGLKLVMDKCIKKEHRRMGGGFSALTD